MGNIPMLYKKISLKLEATGFASFSKLFFQ